MACLLYIAVLTISDLSVYTEFVQKINVAFSITLSLYWQCKMIPKQSRKQLLQLKVKFVI